MEKELSYTVRTNIVQYIDLIEKIFKVSKKSFVFTEVKRTPIDPLNLYTHATNQQIYIKSSLKGETYHKNDLDEYEVFIDTTDGPTIHYIPSGNTIKFSTVEDFINLTRAF